MLIYNLETMSNIVRLIVACVVMGAAVAMCVFGIWGWGILVLFLGGFVLLSYFFNENMIMAQWFLRKEKPEKAEAWLLKITDYEKQLKKAQHGYFNLLIGLIETRKAPMKSEKYFKKALCYRSAFFIWKVMAFVGFLPARCPSS